MIGGLPPQTAMGIADSILLTLALIAGSIVFAATVAALLWVAARLVRRPWDSALRVAGATLGVCVVGAIVAFGLMLASL